DAAAALHEERGEQADGGDARGTAATSIGGVGSILGDQRPRIGSSREAVNKTRPRRRSSCDAGTRRVDSPAVDGRGALGRVGEAARPAQPTTVGARTSRGGAGGFAWVAPAGGVVFLVGAGGRRGPPAGPPLESAGGRRRAQLARVARHFVAANGWHDRDARF